jgi:transposase
MWFVGNDWASDHHDVEIQDAAGQVLVRRRLADGPEGIAALHALLGELVDEQTSPGQVVVGIEKDHGPWVQALIVAGYQVFGINPVQVAQYRLRHHPGGGKSDRGDAHVLAEIVRLDRIHHRQVATDSEIAESVQVVARAHQSMIWSGQRQVSQLRAALTEYYPAALVAFGDRLSSAEALTVLAAAPTPDAGRALSKARIERLLRKAGRQRRVTERATQIVAALRSEQLTARPGVIEAHAAVVSAQIVVIGSITTQIDVLEEQVRTHFGRHPDAEIYLSVPGIGSILGARILGEFGDDPTRFVDAKARRNYAGTSPITRASGKKRMVTARHVRNPRLFAAFHQQAFSALIPSPGARAHYDNRRSNGLSHHQALTAVSNKMVGDLHGCLRHHTPYNEDLAWPIPKAQAA